MKQKLLLLLTVIGLTSVNAQIFKNEITVPSGYIPTTVVMPPSPLSLQVLFVGGHDVVQTTPTYSNPQGRAIAKEWHDFIGVTADPADANAAWVTVNHEMIYQDDRIGDGGGMTSFKVKRKADGQLEIVNQKLNDGREGQYFNIDFVNTVGETGMNCGGIQSPDGRIWTAEEWFRTSTSSIATGNLSSPSSNGQSLPVRVAGIRDGYGVRDTADYTIKTVYEPFNGKKIKKYENFNYMVEVDPKQAVALHKQYNWGRAGWEGGAISKDLKTVYLGIDETPAPFVKFVADVPGDYFKGKLYAWKSDAPAGKKWIEIPGDYVTLKDSLSEFAFKNGATMYLRNEWVAIDPQTDIVYWSETGNDNPATAFRNAAAIGGTYPKHHTDRATALGLANPGTTGYWDYYGSVLYYDPKTETEGVAIAGGPYFATSPAEANYPSKALSNPDGLAVVQVQGKSYLAICEDLNGRSFGRVPAGVNNSTCELFLLDAAKARNAKLEDLIRVSVSPRGAEITGIVMSPDKKSLLVNSQHPNSTNPFPYNHSLTYAIHGLDMLSTAINEPDFEEKLGLQVFPNPASRTIKINKVTDFAIYDVNGKLQRVTNNNDVALIEDLMPGTYFIVTKDKETAKLIIQ